MPGPRGSGQLKVTLPSDREILLSRVFDAPRHLVWEAMTKPEHVRRWWCCMDGFTMPICEIDLRVGGGYRYVMISPDGQEIGFHGEYQEIVPGERLVSTEVYEGFPEGEALNTLTFTEEDGRTTLTLLVKHEKREHRDAHIQSGMEDGMQESFDRLEQVAVSLL